MATLIFIINRNKMEVKCRYKIDRYFASIEALAITSIHIVSFSWSINFRQAIKIYWHIFMLKLQAFGLSEPKRSPSRLLFEMSQSFFYEITNEEKEIWGKKRRKLFAFACVYIFYTLYLCWHIRLRKLNRLRMQCVITIR